MKVFQTEIYEDTNAVVKDVFKQIINATLENGQLEFGELAQKLKSSQIFVTNHQKLIKICNTVFDDGEHIFISEKFARYLIQEARESNNEKFGLEPVLLLHAKKILTQTKDLVTDIPPKYKQNLVDNVLELYDNTEKSFLGALSKWDKPQSINKQKMSETLHKSQLDHIIEQLNLPKYESIMDKAGSFLHNPFGSK